MAPRQVWLFQLGCWVAFATALLHLAAHIAGPATVSPHATAGLSMLSPSYVFIVPGLRRPTFVSVIDGLSLSVALLIATIGATGLAVLKHGSESPLLLRGVTRAFAVGSAGLLVISITDYFSMQTFLISVMAMCFALAAVTPEG